MGAKAAGGNISGIEKELMKEILATKTDINELRAEMHREFKVLEIKIIGFLVTQTVVIVTLIKIL